MSRSQTAVERFDSRYLVNPKSGCWEWIAGTTGDGYGCLRVNAVTRQFGIHSSTIFRIWNGRIRRMASGIKEAA